MSEEIVTAERANGELVRVMEGLSAKEAVAMNCIMCGGTISEAAQAAGIARSTLYDWLEPGRALCEAIAIWKRDLAGTARTRLLMMTDVAIQNVQRALERGDARLAMQLLVKLGVLAAPAVGPTQVEVVTEGLRAKNREVGRGETARERAANFVNGWTEMPPRRKNHKAEMKAVKGDEEIQPPTSLKIAKSAKIWD